MEDGSGPATRTSIKPYPRPWMMDYDTLAWTTLIENYYVHSECVPAIEEAQTQWKVLLLALQFTLCLLVARCVFVCTTPSTYVETVKNMVRLYEKN